MYRIFPYFIPLLPLIVGQSTYTISKDQQIIEYKNKDCQGVIRNGIRIHDVVFKEDETRKLMYPTLCCDDYYMRFSRSSIPILATYAFGNRPNYVVDISMDHLNISKILPGAFVGLNYLYCLDLSHNNLTFIQFGIFNALKRLVILNLDNNLKQIFDNAFTGAPLKKIFLQNNLLESLDDSLFSLQKSSLTFVNLSNNILKDINFTFNGMTNLNELYLNRNYIRHINMADIHCKNIYLRGNNVSQIKGIWKDTKIIDLSENNIKLIEDLGDSFVSSSIVKLYLSLNDIQLKDTSLSGLHNLTHLYLDNNKIEEVPNTVFKDLKSLVLLDMSHNSILQFQYGTFDHVSQMKYLNISYNKFTDLQLHIFSPLQQLVEFNFRNNQVDNLDIESFLYHCPSLQKVGLDGNIWKCRALTNIVRYCLTKHVEVVKGNLTGSENVRGIACVNDDYDIEDNNTGTTERNVFDLKFSENSTFFQFFHKEFEKFYKYLENSQVNSNKSSDIITLDRTSFYSFFNKDFKNSHFYGYLENITVHDVDAKKTSFENTHYYILFCMSLVVMLVLILITLCVISFSLLRKKRFKHSIGVTNQENVELL